MIVQDDPADRGFQILTVVADRVGMQDVLVVVRLGQINHLAGITQTDRSEGLDFTHFESQQSFLDRGERAAFALGVALGLGHVINAQHHVLRGHGESLSASRRQNVLRAEHQHAGFDLSFGR